MFRSLRLLVEELYRR